MFKTKTRFLSFLLVLCLVVSLFAGLGVSALASGTKNTGTRHELCTELSSQALAYYSGEYDWDSLSELEGVATDSSLVAMGSELYNELQELMDDTMTDSVTYKELTNYWQSTDSEDGASNAVLFYSDTVGSSYNREHVWPKSRGSFYQKNAGSDLHHLRPANSEVNSTRSNYTMGDVVGVLASYSTKDYNGKTVLYYNAGSDLVEVNDNIKGDVARILLYVYVRWGQPNLCVDVSTANLPSYDSDDSENNGQAVIEDLDTLLQWCEEDPVDTWEMSRNDCIQNIQGNRNVFIDYPEYAWLLFGREVPSDMATPSHEAENTESYTVTAVSSNTAYGTVSISGNTITAYPAKGYVAKSADVTPAGSAKITRSGNSFVVSAVKADCTVKINFVKETLTAPAVLSFEAPGDVADINTNLGKSVTLPDCSAEVTGYTFLGWVESPMSETTVAPDYYEAGSSYTVQSTSVTLYALYSRTETGGSVGDTAELVTTAPADWSGSYVIGVSAKNTMMSSLSPGKTYLNYDSATFSGTSITNAKDENIFTLSKVGSYYAIQSSDGAYLKCGGAKDISLDSAKTAVTAADTAYLWSVNVGSIAPCTASYGKLQYNASAPRFTTYTSAQTAIGLYRIGEADTVYYVTLSGESHTHSYTAVVKEPTCTEQGYTTYTCTCGYSYVANYVDAIGHSYGSAVFDWNGNSCKATFTCEHCGHKQTLNCTVASTVSKPATCTETGSIAYTASVVFEGRTYISDNLEILEKLPHTACEAIIENEVVPSCTVAGSYDEVVYCTSCGEELSRVSNTVEALGHDYGEWTITTSPTCTTSGIGIRLCSRCDAYETRAIDDLGHDYKNGKCTRCGEADPDWVNPFVDVSESAVYYNAVLWAYYHEPKQITAGFTETEFRPDAGCTRAQVVTFLWRAAGEPEPESDVCPFVDVSDTSPFRTAIIWASEQNITKGIDATHFAPGANVTRAQFVTFLWRYSGSPEIKNAANPFTDVSESSVYYPAIIWAAETGITNGYGNSDFRPGMTCTRWHVVLFLQRALENEV